MRDSINKYDEVDRLVDLAKDSKKWFAVYGKLSFVDVISTKENKKLLAQDISEPKGKTLHGTHGVYFGFSAAKCRKPKVATKSRQVVIIRHAKSGKTEKITTCTTGHIYKSNKVAKSNKIAKKSSNVKVVTSNGKKCATSKLRIVKIHLNNGFILKKIYQGDVLIEQRYI